MGKRAPDAVTGCDKVPYKIIALALREGMVVPFLGAAASAVCRPDPAKAWQPGDPFMPFGTELARYLAQLGAFPDVDKANDLPLVASYYIYCHGDRRLLNLELRKIFNVTCRPGKLHLLLADIEQPLLLATTNYDDLIEQALAERHRDFHLVVDCGDRARVRVARGQGDLRQVKTSELREALDPQDIPIVYKVHGSLNRANTKNDSFMITEQDYVDFLGRGSPLIPAYLLERMRGMSFLFLGYRLVDWNVRVLLRKLGQRPRTDLEDIRSWVMTRKPKGADERIWSKHGVEMYDCELSVFAERLEESLSPLKDSPPGPNGLPPDVKGPSAGKTVNVHALKHRDTGSSHQD